jgi:hypothetical protein
MRKKTHGMTNAPEYKVWNRITQICHNKNNPSFKIYGELGVEVCEVWRNNPAAFIEDVGQKPPGKFYFQRIDIKKNFEPGNVKWSPVVYVRHRGVHRLTRGVEYAAWRKIKMRCFKANDPAFDRYGGRGISMFDGWKNDFMAFYNYLGPKPSKKHSIDRIDNNRGYEPGNVRWATQIQQARNKRNIKMIQICCQIKSLPEWCEIYGKKRALVAGRLRRGWDLIKALNKPIPANKRIT